MNCRAAVMHDETLREYDHIDACIAFVFWLCQHCLSGARPCMVTYIAIYWNVWIAEMWQICGYWNIVLSIHLILFIYFFPEEPNITVSSGKHQAKHVDTWAFVTETTVIRRMLTTKFVKGTCMRLVIGVIDSLFNSSRFIDVFHGLGVRFSEG